MSKAEPTCADWQWASLYGIDRVIAKWPRCPMTAQYILLRTRNQIIDRLPKPKRRSEREESSNHKRSIRVSISSRFRVGNPEKRMAGMNPASLARVVWLATRLQNRC